MARQHMCEFCTQKFDRKDVLPPLGARKPPGMGWRCRPCHGKDLQQQLKAVVANARLQGLISA